MSYPSTILADSPTMYYRFGETAGATTIVDEMAANNGTLSGSPSLAQTGLISGDPDKAIAFSGSNFVSLGTTDPWISSTGASAGSLSAECWINLTSFGGARVLGKWPNGNQQQRVLLNVNSDGSIAVGIYNNSTYLIGSTVVGLISLNTTYHLAFSWLGSASLGIWVNGVSKAVTISSGGTFTTFAALTSQALLVGKSSDQNDGIVGRIDEVAFYRSNPGTTRWLAHYTAGAAASTPSPAPILTDGAMGFTGIRTGGRL